VEMFNGFANRILWACVKRSKRLAFGGKADDATTQALGARAADIAARARFVGEIGWTSTGRDAWENAYGPLTQDRPGLLGGATSRAEAHALRLAMNFALLDRSREIAQEHVEAALEVWRFSFESAAVLFGRSTGDRHGDKILAALKASPKGLTRTDIYRDVFKNNMDADIIRQTLKRLINAGSVVSIAGTSGAERFHAA